MIRFVAFTIVLLGCASCATQPSRTLPDSIGWRYADRAVVHPDFPVLAAKTDRFTLGEPESIRFVPNAELVLFLRSGPEAFEQDLYALDLATGEERVLLTADALLGGATETLSVEEKARRERMRQTARGIASYQLSKDGKYCLVPLSGELFVYAMQSGDVTRVNGNEGYPLSPSFSPDGSAIALVRDRDVYVADWRAGTERRLTFAEHDEQTNGLSEFVAQEEMGRLEGYWWSPDGARIVYQQTDTWPVEKLYIMDAANPDREPQQWPYPRAGTANADVRLGIIPVEGGETVWIDWDRERYPYLVNVTWSKNVPLMVQVQNRAQTENVLYEADPDSGALTELLVETDPAWINIDQQMPKWLPDGSGFFWTTEREGYWQLERRNADGSLRNVLLPVDIGDEEVSDVQGFSWRIGYQGFVSCNGETGEALVYVPGAYGQREVYGVSIDGSEQLTPLTTTPGLNTLIADAKHERLILRSEDMTGATPWRVVNRDGTHIGEIASHAMEAPFVPNVELTRVLGVDTGDFITAAIIRPHAFNPHKKYPVIESVYGGPGPNYVTVSGSRYLQDQWLADQGFIVVRIDARGTPNRGRDWERAIKGDLIAVPLADHVAALTALGKRYPEMDMDRVGIYGWSFGGYFSAMAVMRNPELYKAGVAGAPVVQWEDYDTHYTERYMGLPSENAEGYRAANVLTYAVDLKRPLLLIHGTTDDNVYFMHSLKLSDALYRAGVPYEILPLSNFTHMVADPEVAAQRAYRTLAFFQDHLWTSADYADVRR